MDFVQSIGIRELEENIVLQILNIAGHYPGLRTPVQIIFDETSATAISKRKASTLHQVQCETQHTNSHTSPPWHSINESRTRRPTV